MGNIAWDKLIKQGVFAALFIMLLVYTMNEGKAREQQYQKTIEQVNLTNSKYADLIKLDLAEIKANMKER